MKCKSIQNHLEDHLKQCLDPATENAVTAHLVTCPACRRELAFLKTYLSALHPFETENAPSDLPNRIETAIANGPQPYRFPWSWKIVSAFSGVSFAMVMLIILVWCVPRPMPLPLEKKSVSKVTHAQAPHPPQTENLDSGSKMDTAILEGGPVPKTAIAAKAKPVARSEDKPAKPAMSTLLVTLETSVQSEPALKSNMRALMLKKTESSETTVAENSQNAANPVPETDRSDNVEHRFMANLTQLLRDYHGEIVQEKSDPNTRRLSRIIVKIPAEFYPALLTELGKTSSISQTGPEPSPAPGTGWRQIELQLEYQQ